MKRLNAFHLLGIENIHKHFLTLLQEAYLQKQKVFEFLDKV